MKVWAYIHPDLNTLCCALLQSAVPEEVNAIEFDVNSTDDIILDNGKIRLKTDEEKLQEAKQKAISDLYSKLYTYIFKYYNDAQLKIDLINKEVGENYLVYKGIDTTAFRKDVSALILSNTDFKTAVSNLNKNYNSNNDQMISFWINELLKIAYRHYFAFLVSQEYTAYIQQIQQATSLPLPTFEFKTPYPSLP
jgi:hypothetical protein